MNQYTQNSCHKQTRGDLSSVPMRTTLYDLIGAMHTDTGSQASDLITSAVSYVLNAYHVSCLGDFAGRRMILDEKETSYSAVA